MATTYKTFGANLADLSITGVQDKLSQPPETLNPGDLPAYWVQSVSGREEAWTVSAHGGWPALAAELVVAVESVQLNTRSQNYLDTLTMMDNISAALRAATQVDPGGTNTANLGLGKVEWDIRYDFLTIGDATFWAVIAEIEAHG